MSLLVLALETLLAPLVALGVLLGFLLSGRRRRLQGLLSEELGERLGRVPQAARARLGGAPPLAGRQLWWLHAASAGEVAGLAPIVAALAQRSPPPAVLLTTSTRAGREAARALPGVAWSQLAPLDAWPCVARFLAGARPDRLLLAETELWPSTLILAERAHLRPALINARMTERSLRRYRALRPLLGPALRALSLIAAQSEADAERFRALGAPAGRVRVTGNAKYDQQAAPAATEIARGRLEALGWIGAPLCVAGSTHPIEEELVLGAFLAARRRAPGLRLVLAPRHVERARDCAELFKSAGLRFETWSGPVLTARGGGAEVLLLDAMGALPSFYPLAAAAFVGGTLVPVGGHNLLEPALAATPVLFGPHTEHVCEPARLLESGGGGWRVRDAAELAERLAALAGDRTRAKAAGQKARRLAEGLRGATGRILAELERSRA